MAEIGRIGDDGRERHAWILGGPARMRMGERGGEAGPSVDLGEEIGDPDRGQAGVERRERASVSSGVTAFSGVIRIRPSASRTSSNAWRSASRPTSARRRSKSARGRRARRRPIAAPGSAAG